MNRDESLAFWYLRLNGFFLIPHFVVHTEPPSEIDFLGLRPPRVAEDVGGRPEDWDPAFIDEEDREHFLFVLCEVKGGRSYNVETVFRAREIQYALPRYGMLDEEERERAMADLRREERSYPRDDLQVRKLLVAHQEVNGLPPCDFVPLERTWRFLRDRLEEYHEAKAGARVLFNADRVDELLADIDRARGWAHALCPNCG